MLKVQTLRKPDLALASTGRRSDLHSRTLMLKKGCIKISNGKLKGGDSK